MVKQQANRVITMWRQKWDRALGCEQRGNRQEVSSKELHLRQINANERVLCCSEQMKRRKERELRATREEREPRDMELCVSGLYEAYVCE